MSADGLMEQRKGLELAIIHNCGVEQPKKSYSSSSYRQTALPPEITLKAYAAIHLLVPESGIEWLDKMIKEKVESMDRAKQV